MSEIGTAVRTTLVSGIQTAFPISSGEPIIVHSIESTLRISGTSLAVTLLDGTGTTIAIVSIIGGTFVLDFPWEACHGLYVTQG